MHQSVHVILTCVETQRLASRYQVYRKTKVNIRFIGQSLHKSVECTSCVMTGISETGININIDSFFVNNVAFTQPVRQHSQSSHSSEILFCFA